MNKDIELKWYTYGELDKDLLYEILRFRQEVFVVEQQSPYLDSDGHDQSSFHLVGLQDGIIVAYARLKPNEEAEEPYLKFGRLLLRKPFRGSGAGVKLLTALFDFAEHNYPGLIQKADAQSDLIEYYRQFGFRPIGAPFDDGGVLHQTIVRRSSSIDK